MRKKTSLKDEGLDRSFHRWRVIDRWIDRSIWSVLIILLIVTGGAAFDQWQSARGASVPYRDFGTLCDINPDTVAWLTIDKTGIDHPVVQGKDNFEYLDKNFAGEFSAAGTLFLDARNDAGLSDAYSMVHGHHMAGGAMFGGLERYLDEEYSGTHGRGRLLTRTWDYELTLIGAGICDAYDSRIYAPGEVPEAEAIRQVTGREYEGTDREHEGAGREHGGSGGGGAGRILALSTCTGSMDDSRIVLFWKMEHPRPHM